MNLQDNAVVSPAVLPTSVRLEDALRGERRLLDELGAVLAQQRAGIAADSLASVDDTVFAAQRILLTLTQARQRRLSLLTLLTGRGDVPLGELEEELGALATRSLCAARDELREAARRLSRELERNHRILEAALAAGDRLIGALRAPPPPAVYSATDGETVSPGSAMIDRRV